MTPIQNILVPTDFSETSNNAFLYAHRMAQVLGASLRVVNIQSIPIMDDFSYSANFLGDMRQSAQASLDEFVHGDGGTHKSSPKCKSKRKSIWESLWTISAAYLKDLTLI